jgi:hypothetical protein
VQKNGIVSKRLASGDSLLGFTLTATNVARTVLLSSMTGIAKDCGAQLSGYDPRPEPNANRKTYFGNPKKYDYVCLNVV